MFRDGEHSDVPAAHGCHGEEPRGEQDLRRPQPSRPGRQRGQRGGRRRVEEPDRQVEADARAERGAHLGDRLDGALLAHEQEDLERVEEELDRVRADERPHQRGAEQPGAMNRPRAGLGRVALLGPPEAAGHRLDQISGEKRPEDDRADDPVAVEVHPDDVENADGDPLAPCPAVAGREPQDRRDQQKGEQLRTQVEALVGHERKEGEAGGGDHRLPGLRRAPEPEPAPHGARRQEAQPREQGHAQRHQPRRPGRGVHQVDHDVLQPLVVEPLVVREREREDLPAGRGGIAQQVLAGDEMEREVVVVDLVRPERQVEGEDPRRGDPHGRPGPRRSGGRGGFLTLSCAVQWRRTSPPAPPR